jgi:hypothetical protein
MTGPIGNWIQASVRTTLTWRQPASIKVMLGLPGWLKRIDIASTPSQDHQRLFGLSFVRRLPVCLRSWICHLLSLSPRKQWTRLGLGSFQTSILEVPLPHTRITRLKQSLAYCQFPIWWPHSGDSILNLYRLPPACSSPDCANTR